MAKITMANEVKRLGKLTIDKMDLFKAGFTLEEPDRSNGRPGDIGKSYSKVLDNDGRFFGQAFGTSDEDMFKVNVRASPDKIVFNGFEKTSSVYRGKVSGIGSLPLVYRRYPGDVVYDNTCGSEVMTFRDDGFKVQIFGRPETTEDRTFLVFAKSSLKDVEKSIQRFFEKL